MTTHPTPAVPLRARMLVVIAAALLVSPLTSFGQSTRANPFGVFPAKAWVQVSNVWEPNHDLDQENDALVAAVHNLGVPYVRMVFRNLNTSYDESDHTWSDQPTSPGVSMWERYQRYVVGQNNNTWTEGRCKVLANFNWQGGKQQDGSFSTFPTGTNLTTYIDRLTAVLDDMNALPTTGSDQFPMKLPVMIVVENEETNPNYYGWEDETGGQARENYLAQLEAAIAIAHDHLTGKRLPITNGGLLKDYFFLYAWNYYYNVKGDSATALQLYNDGNMAGFFTTYPTILKGTAGSHEAVDKLAMAQKLIDGYGSQKGYKDLALDYVNIHWYLQPNDYDDPADHSNHTAARLNAVKLAADALTLVTGKPVISNEMGARITDLNHPLPPNSWGNNGAGDASFTIKPIMEAFHKMMQMPYVIWYSGPGPDAFPVALVEQDGALTTTTSPSGSVGDGGVGKNGYGTKFRDYIETNFDEPFGDYAQTGQTSPYWQGTSPNFTPAAAVSISTQPATVVVSSGNATFTANITTGTSCWFYEWYQVGNTAAVQVTDPAVTAMSDTLTRSTTGTYYCIVTNPAGAVFSTDAMLWNWLKIGGGNYSTASYSSGTDTYTVYGKGALLDTGTTDIFQLVGQTVVTYPVTIIAKVAITGGSSGQAGLMMRASSATGSRYVFLGPTGGGTMTQRWVRETTGAGGAHVDALSAVATWVKLDVDEGGNVRCYYSQSAGGNPPALWSGPLGGVVEVPYTNPLIGLAVAGTGSSQTTATFTHVSVF